MRIGYYCDPHIRGKSPINRIDDFTASILKKIEQAYSLFKKKKCDFVISGGDIFDTPIISLNLCDAFLDIIEKQELRTYLLFGNHSLQNASIANSSATTLAHCLRRCSKLLYVNELNLDDIYIKFIEYEYLVEDKVKEELKRKDLSKDKCCILCPHCMITESKLPFDIPHIAADTIKTNYDYILCSHNHAQFTQFEKIIAPGALARLSIAKHDVNRVPTVAIIDTTKRKVEYIELSVPPIEDTFDLSNADKEEKRDVNLDEFFKSLESANFQEMNLLGIIQKMADESKLRKEVKEFILKKLETK